MQLREVKTMQGEICFSWFPKSKVISVSWSFLSGDVIVFCVLSFLRSHVQVLSLLGEVHSCCCLSFVPVIVIVIVTIVSTIIVIVFVIAIVIVIVTIVFFYHCHCHCLLS